MAIASWASTAAPYSLLQPPRALEKSPRQADQSVAICGIEEVRYDPLVLGGEPILLDQERPKVLEDDRELLDLTVARVYPFDCDGPQSANEVEREGSYGVAAKMPTIAQSVLLGDGGYGGRFDEIANRDQRVGRDTAVHCSRCSEAQLLSSGT